MQLQPLTISQDQSNFLRGLAITAVMLIHFLATLPHVYLTSRYPLFFIAIDQLSRFCVPLFLFLSAYGLTKKYTKTTLKWTSYFVSRLGKLIPLYLLWSFFSILFFVFMSEWRYDNKPTSLFVTLLFGQADYQLYFLPLIFQLYLLFPLLRILVKKYAFATLAVSLLTQMVWYLYLSGYIPTLIPKNTDSISYVIFLSWIGYFVSGIYIAERGIPNLLHKLLPAILGMGMVCVIYSSWSAIQHGIDPLVALRFTRVPIFFFAESFSLFAGAYLIHWSAYFGRAKNVLASMGKNSYLFFLAHTLGLRFLFAYQLPEVPWQKMAVAIGSWIVMIILSKKILKNG